MNVTTAECWLPLSGGPGSLSSLEPCASSHRPLACLPSQTGDLHQVVFKTSSNSDLFWRGPHAQAFCLWSGCRDRQQQAEVLKVLKPLLGARNWAVSLMWTDPVSPYPPRETDCSISWMGQLWLMKA